MRKEDRDKGEVLPELRSKDGRRKAGRMTEYNHWCGNCQIRIYVFRHCGKVLSWQNCQYSCEYGYAMRNSTKTIAYTPCADGEREDDE